MRYRPGETLRQLVLNILSSVTRLKLVGETREHELLQHRWSGPSNAHTYGTLWPPQTSNGSGCASSRSLLRGHLSCTHTRVGHQVLGYASITEPVHTPEDKNASWHTQIQELQRITSYFVVNNLGAQLARLVA